MNSPSRKKSFLRKKELLPFKPETEQETGGAESETLEALDGRGRPFMLMPAREIAKQGLCRKAVIVALRDKEGKIYIRKCKTEGNADAPQWGLSAGGPVLPEEAWEDAALRHAAEQLPFPEFASGRLKLENPLFFRADNPALLACLFISALPAAQALKLAARRTRPGPDQGFFISRDELDGLCRDMPELLEPGLLNAALQGLLFS